MQHNFDMTDYPPPAGAPEPPLYSTMVQITFQNEDIERIQRNLQDDLDLTELYKHIGQAVVRMAIEKHLAHDITMSTKEFTVRG